MTEILLHPLYCFGSTKRAQNEWKTEQWVWVWWPWMLIWAQDVQQGLFHKHAEPLVSPLFDFYFSFKAVFPSVVPKSHQPLMCWMWLSGPGSRTSPCAQEVMPVTPVIQKQILPTNLPGPLKGASSRGELEKISPQKRPDFSQQEIWPSGDVVCKPPPTCGVMHNTHANSPGVFQEHFQFPGGFPVFISYRSWCSEPQRPPIQFLRTWACCPWPKNSQISQLARGIMKTWNKSSLLLISFSLSWLFLYLAIHPMTSLSPFSCGPTPEPTPPFPECPS